MSPRQADYAENEVRSLLERDEGQFLEFKSLWNRDRVPPRPLPRRKARDLAAQSVAAFANADGGTLLLGVVDDGEPTGHAYPETAVEALLATPERRLQPPVRCRVQRLNIDGHEVLLLDVPMAPEAVMMEGNGFPYRAGDRVVREPQDVINERKQAYRRVGYEQRVRSEATLEDLDLELAARFLARTPIAGRRVEEALERYGLVVPRAGGPAVTNAALLSFARAPLPRWHPRAGLRLFRVAGRRRRHGAQRNVTQLGRVEEPLATAIEAAYGLVRAQIRRSESLHDLFFRELPEYPEFAWQETIVNAIAHRDYEDQGRETEVWFYDDRMEVKSPGVLVPPVTVDVLRERRPAHASRNPLLVRVLAEAGLMRDEGEGIPRMHEEMEASFLQPPDFDVGDGEFRVTLRNEPVFEGPSREWQRLVDRLGLPVRQRRALLAHPGGLTNEDYRGLNRVDRDQAYREIQELVTRGVLAPAEAPGRAAVYRVAPDLHEALAFLQQRLPRLRDHFRRRPRLKNADYRELFGVTRHAALRELRRLTDEGWLRLEGERRGAHYLPGEALGEQLGGDAEE